MKLPFCIYLATFVLAGAYLSAKPIDSAFTMLDECGREHDITISHAERSRDGLEASIAVENYSASDRRFEIVLVPEGRPEHSLVAKFAAETADVICIIHDRWIGDLQFVEFNSHVNSHRFRADCVGDRGMHAEEECEGRV